MKHTVVALTLLVSVVACGGGGGPSPSAPNNVPAPTPTPPPAFAVVDGVTGQTLEPASVLPADPQTGQSVTIVHDGYLTREQPWEGSPVALWPSRNEQDADAFQQLVYGRERRPLVRWTEMNIEASLQIVGDAWADEGPSIRAELDAAFAEIAALGGPTFSWSGDSANLEVAGDSGLQVIVDRYHECLEDQYAACAQWWTNGSTIARGALIFDSPRMTRDHRTRRYVLGHVVGLSQLDMLGTAMNEAYWSRGDSFHELERIAVRMMYAHRNPGNVLPDRDPGFTSSGAAAGVHRRVDRGPERPR